MSQLSDAELRIKYEQLYGVQNGIADHLAHQAEIARALPAIADAVGVAATGVEMVNTVRGAVGLAQKAATLSGQGVNEFVLDVALEASGVSPSSTAGFFDGYGGGSWSDLLWQAEAAMGQMPEVEASLRTLEQEIRPPTFEQFKSAYEAGQLYLEQVKEQSALTSAKLRVLSLIDEIQGAYVDTLGLYADATEKNRLIKLFEADAYARIPEQNDEYNRIQILLDELSDYNKSGTQNLASKVTAFDTGDSIGDDPIPAVLVRTQNAIDALLSGNPSAENYKLLAGELEIIRDRAIALRTEAQATHDALPLLPPEILEFAAELNGEKAPAEDKGDGGETPIAGPAPIPEPITIDPPPNAYVPSGPPLSLGQIGGINLDIDFKSLVPNWNLPSPAFNLNGLGGLGLNGAGLNLGTLALPPAFQNLIDAAPQLQNQYNALQAALDAGDWGQAAGLAQAFINNASHALTGENAVNLSPDTLKLLDDANRFSQALDRGDLVGMLTTGGKLVNAFGIEGVEVDLGNSANLQGLGALASLYTALQNGDSAAIFKYGLETLNYFDALGEGGSTWAGMSNLQGNVGAMTSLTGLLNALDSGDSAAALSSGLQLAQQVSTMAGNTALATAANDAREVFHAA